MKRPIWFIGGSKGGVGKSTLAMLLIDYARHRRGEHVYVVDTDPTNPDVARPYALEPEDGVEYATIMVRDTGGWIDTLEAAEEHPDRVTVINGAAGDIDSLRDASHVLRAVAELDRELVVWWVVGGEVESVWLLHRYVEFMGSASEGCHRKLVVALNPGLGNERVFRDYRESQIAQRVASEGCPVVTFPYLAKDVAKDVRRMKMSISRVRPALPALRRAELNRWVNVAAGPIAVAVGDG